jgi:hypothetical protein
MHSHTRHGIVDKVRSLMKRFFERGTTNLKIGSSVTYLFFIIIQ